ncbi:MAG: class I SAM-dependent methyltransferase, partial [Myxococcota bacterium]
MTDYKQIYRDHTDAYDRLVAAEDCDGNLLPAIAVRVDLDGARVIEAGVGTGRVARLLLAAGVTSLLGCDESAEMLAVARDHLQRNPDAAGRWQLAVADIAALPSADGSADLAIAAWVLGHTTEWMAGDWPELVDRAVAEMSRVVKPGGAVILIETLGTGAAEPA